VLTLKQYLAAQHVGVGIWGELQTLPDKRLAGIGEKRRCPIWVPLFHCRHSVRSGHPIARDRSAGFESKNPPLKILKPREVLGRKVQLSDGLASTHEYRRRPPMDASRDTRDSEGSLPARSRWLK
jgi:hypothetical protein